MILEKSKIRASQDIDLAASNTILEYDAKLCIQEIIKIRNESGKPKGIFHVIIQFEIKEI